MNQVTIQAMQTIYGLVRDHGDGSSSITWHKSKEVVDKLLDHKTADESYIYSNDDGPLVLTFPYHFDLIACGFKFVE